MAIFQAGNRQFPLGKRCYVMGILNVTPDSFSDGGHFLSPGAAITQALILQEAGADILDIGAQSTRPGAVCISAEEELSRLVPVLEGLRGRLTIPVSIDTFYPACARYGLEHGAYIINDVSGAVNAEMAALVKEHNAGWIIAHNPCNENGQTAYVEGVAAAVRNFFREALERAISYGLRPEQICLDPGFGFGKSPLENRTLLRELDSVRIADAALLAGLSRKRFIAEAVGTHDLAALDTGTLAAHTLAIQKGADFIRAHNVKMAVAAVKVADAVCRDNLL